MLENASHHVSAALIFYSAGSRLPWLPVHSVIIRGASWPSALYTLSRFAGAAIYGPILQPLEVFTELSIKLLASKLHILSFRHRFVLKHCPLMSNKPIVP